MTKRDLSALLRATALAGVALGVLEPLAGRTAAMAASGTIETTTTPQSSVNNQVPAGGGIALDPVMPGDVIQVINADILQTNAGVGPNSILYFNVVGTTNETTTVYFSGNNTLNGTLSNSAGLLRGYIPPAPMPVWLPSQFG